jgi:hypothetical protein
MRSRNVIITIIFLAVLSGTFLFFQDKKNTIRKDENSAFQKYSNSEYGLSFTYPSNYLLEESDSLGSGMRKHHIINLINKKDLPAPEGGEGAPSIIIGIYQNNLDKQTTEQWIRNSSDSNFKLGEGRLSTTTISGLPALSYRWSGLYEGTTIAVAEPNWVYSFTVDYLEMGDQIVQDFVSVRDSIKIFNK